MGRRPAEVEPVGEVWSEETIATGRQIREVGRLKRIYGRGRWRKCKGIALVRLPDGNVRRAEVHWYEAHALGRREFKVKRFLPE